MLSSGLLMLGAGAAVVVVAAGGGMLSSGLLILGEATVVVPGRGAMLFEETSELVTTENGTDDGKAGTLVSGMNGVIEGFVN